MTYTEGYTGDWRETEFSVASVRWRVLDSTSVVVTARRETGWAADVDLRKVDEVGFTNLMRGSGNLSRAREWRWPGWESRVN